MYSSFAASVFQSRIFSRSCCVALFFFAAVLPANAQLAVLGDNPEILVTGIVIDKTDSTYSPIPVVVNRRTGSGRMGKADGTFSIPINKQDTLLITSTGYQNLKICFRDSAYKSTYQLRIGLAPKVTTIRGVAIYPVRTLQEVKKDREAVDTRKPDYVTNKPYEVLESPITALYERFSRRGQSMRYVAEMEALDRKKDVLRDLFRIYVKADVIDLDEDEFDKFIVFLNMDDQFIRSASDYQLVTAIKERYDKFREIENIGKRKRY